MRMGTSRFASLTLLCALLVSAPAAAQGKKSKAKAKPAAALSESDAGDKGGKKEKISSEPEDEPVAASGGMCIGSGVPAAIAECPANMGKAKGKIAGAPDSKLRQSKRKVEQPKGAKAGGPSIELDVATLRNKEKVEEKAEGLLKREIQVTKRLIQNTRTNDPRRPDFLLRLAEGYFGLVQVATRNVRKLDDPIHQAVRSREQGQLRQARKQQKDAEGSMSGIREDNIKTLAQLVKDHPDYKKMDEVLFALGFSLEEMKQFDRARQVYHRLIKTYPQSGFVPNAYLSFAEYYFQQGDMQAAKQFYSKVTEIPPERNKVYGFALYKQAWCDYNLEDFKGALQKFVETIEFAQQNPEASNVENLAKQSRRELVMPYAQVGSPGTRSSSSAAMPRRRAGVRHARVARRAVLRHRQVAGGHRDLPQADRREVEQREGLLLADARNQRRHQQQAQGGSGHRDRAHDRSLRHLRREQAERDGEADVQASRGSVLIDLRPRGPRGDVTDTHPYQRPQTMGSLRSSLDDLEHFPDMSRAFPDIDKRDGPTSTRFSTTPSSL